MIHGKVNSSLEPRISIAVHDASGNKQPIEATLDTGFNGYMTLPGNAILSLGLTKSGSTRIILGDGRVEKCCVFGLSLIGMEFPWTSKSKLPTSSLLSEPASCKAFTSMSRSKKGAKLSSNG